MILPDPDQQERMFMIFFILVNAISFLILTYFYLFDMCH